MVSVGLILSYTSLSASDVPSTVPFLCKRTRLPDYSIYRLKPVNWVSHSSSRVTSCASWANHFSTTTAHTLLTKLKSPISRFPTAYSNKDQSERIWPLLLNFLQPGAIEKHSYFSANKSNPISVPELQIWLPHKERRFRISWHLGKRTLMIFVTTEFGLLSRGKRKS